MIQRQVKEKVVEVMITDGQELLNIYGCRSLHIGRLSQKDGLITCARLMLLVDKVQDQKLGCDSRR